MKEVFKCENYRLKKTKGIWVMGIALVVIQVLGLLSVLAVKYLPIFHQLRENLGDALYSEVPSFFAPFGYAANSQSFRILFIIVTCSLVIKLYQSGVTKQLVSSGVRRKNVILGQFVSFTIVFSIVAFIEVIANGICNVMQGGKIAFADVNLGRLALSVLGTILVVASLTALFLLISHLVGSLAAAIVIGLAYQLAGPMGAMTLSFYTNSDAISKYFLTNIQSEAVSMTGTVGTQLMNMAMLVAITAVMLVACIKVFQHKEIK